MTWNYRLIHHSPPETKRSWWAIHEVYYDADGKPEMVTEAADGVTGETLDEARERYAQMAEAFEQPVLEAEDIPGYQPDPEKKGAIMTIDQYAAAALTGLLAAQADYDEPRPPQEIVDDAWSYARLMVAAERQER